jgi:hypothetical protein
MDHQDGDQNNPNSGDDQLDTGADLVSGTSLGGHPHSPHPYTSPMKGSLGFGTNGIDLNGHSQSASGYASPAIGNGLHFGTNGTTFNGHQQSTSPHVSTLPINGTQYTNNAVPTSDIFPQAAIYSSPALPGINGSGVPSHNTNGNGMTSHITNGNGTLPNIANGNGVMSHLSHIPNPLLTHNFFQSTMHQPGLPPPALPPTMHQQQAAPTQAALHGMSLVRKGKRYTLEVVQQPQRARMCGFGDKDRRPITPPPCIRLTITDQATGREVDPNDVDPTYFVLCVDLWDDRGGNEVNLVRHSTASPAVSISAATPCAYPPPPERPYIGLLNPSQMAQFYPQQQPQMGYQQPQYDPMFNAHGGGMQPSYVQAASTPVSIVPNHSQGMYTRNLIGSLAVNAAKLQDDHNRTGLWFVLQDLSVRTEGVFRLHMRFIDVSDGNTEGQLNTEHAPVLASCYSSSFQVYSAKKFPGVVESTPLSRAFATQGIKIPIRKDGNKIANQGEYDADDK